MKFIINLTNDEYKTIENILKKHDNIPAPKNFDMKQFSEAESVKISYGPMSIETDKKNTISLEIEEDVACKVIMAAFLFINDITTAAKSFIEKLMAFNPKGDTKPKVEYTYPNGDRKMAGHNINDFVELKSMGYKGSLVAKEYAIIGEQLNDDNVQIALFGNGRYEFARIVNSKNKYSIANATEEAIERLCGEIKRKYNINNVYWNQEELNDFVESHYKG